MKTVFIVDDELLSRQSLKTSITWENYGYRLCGESSNGEQALKIISSLHPDVIITDIKMPVMDGLEAARQIRASARPDRRIPIVALSANAFDEDTQRSLDAGMQAHLAKPVDIIELKRILKLYIK